MGFNSGFKGLMHSRLSSISRRHVVTTWLYLLQKNNISAKRTPRKLFLYSIVVTKVPSRIFACSSSQVSGEYYYHKSHFMGVVYIVELQLGTESSGVRPNQQDTGFCLWF